MQANEFVKKFGWNDARVCILNCASPKDKWLMRHGELISDDAFDDLKRLVESYELVQSYGSLEDAKKALSKKSMLRWIDPETELLRKAIADVESCQ